MSKIKLIQIESKNALLEILKEGKPVDRIYVAHNAFKDEKTKEILELAHKNQVPVIKSPRKSLRRLGKTGNTESVIAFIPMENQWNLSELIEKIYSQGLNPFFLLLDHVKYEQNIGAILRTAYAAGVNGVITPIKKESFLTTEAIRVSMGAATRIPLVEMNVFMALKELQKNSIRTFAVTMDGKAYYEENLKGPIAFVLGAEDVGISTRVLEKVDGKISIPMREGIGSLNVSASGAIISYEKLRQEVTA